MSRGLPSMTALLGLLAIAGYQNRDKIAEMLRGLGRTSLALTSKGALAAGLANWVSGAPAPEAFSVVGSASSWSASSRAARAKPQSPGSTPGPTSHARRTNLSGRLGPRCWTRYPNKQVYRETS